MIDMLFDPKAHVTCSTTINHGLTSNNGSFCNFKILHSKTKYKGDIISIMNSNCVCSPIVAFDHHLKSNANILPDAPLFAFETSSGSWAPMKWKWFLDHCNEIWSKHDFGSVKGHGFRLGGSTHLLLLGVDPWIVMVQGHWSSQSFLTYWHKCKEILPMFIVTSCNTHVTLLTNIS